MLTAVPLLLAAAAPAADTPVATPPEPIVAVAMPTPPTPPDAPQWQVVIEQQLIIRVPAQRTPLSNFAASPPRPSASSRSDRLEGKEGAEMRRDA